MKNSWEINGNSCSPTQWIQQLAAIQVICRTDVKLIMPLRIASERHFVLKPNQAFPILTISHQVTYSDVINIGLPIWEGLGGLQVYSIQHLVGCSRCTLDVFASLLT